MTGTAKGQYLSFFHYNLVSMKCFENYLSALRSVTSKNADPDAPDVDLCGACPSEAYFNEVDKCTSDLLDFFRKEVASSQDAHQWLRDLLPMEGFEGDEDLMLCLLMDIVNCYNGLDHPTSLGSKEGLSLLDILSKVYRPDYCMLYSQLGEVPQIIIDLDAMVSYITECVDFVPLMRTSSLVSEILSMYDPEADRRYRILLYRFCKEVSVVDCDISSSEEQYLRSLLRLDDEDAGNDILLD